MNVNTVADALEGTVISMGKINLQGLKGEEIQEKLMAVFLVLLLISWHKQVLKV